MKVLLDTQAFLWFAVGDDRLSEQARKVIAAPRNEVLLSMASVWEMAIKVSIGKLRLAGPFDEVIPEQLKQLQIGILEIAFSHVIHVSTMSFHHRDPFDRLILAQAHVERLPVLLRRSDPRRSHHFGAVAQRIEHEKKRFIPFVVTIFLNRRGEDALSGCSCQNTGQVVVVCMDVKIFRAKSMWPWIFALPAYTDAIPFTICIFCTT